MNGLLKTACILVLAMMPGLAAAESEERSEGVSASDQVQPQPAPAASPVQMLRTLQLMQDQIAEGSTEAYLGQRGLLTILDKRFMELDAGLWADSRNVHAAIAFVLSGGNPQILRKLLEMSDPVLTAETRTLVEGALAYVEGREEKAKGDLLSFDAGTFPPMFGAQLALVQSALVVRTDARKSSDLLDFVRLQAPGTLLEEGALRRQVFVASQTGDTRKFLALSSGYLRRYRHSIYAGNFRQRLASALTRIDFGKDPVLFDGVVEMLQDLELEARLDLYLLAARSSIDQGLTKSARMLAEKAQELSHGDPKSAARARLYRAAAMIVSPETIAVAVEELKSIRKDVLSASDATLLDSALSMADHIRQSPGEKVAENGSQRSPVQVGTGTPSSPDARRQQAPEQLEALLKAQDALSRIDKLIKNQASTVQ